MLDVVGPCVAPDGLATIACRHRGLRWAAPALNGFSMFEKSRVGPDRTRGPESQKTPRRNSWAAAGRDSRAGQPSGDGGQQRLGAASRQQRADKRGGDAPMRPQLYSDLVVFWVLRLAACGRAGRRNQIDRTRPRPKSPNGVWTLNFHACGGR